MTISYEQDRSKLCFKRLRVPYPPLTAGYPQFDYIIGEKIRINPRELLLGKSIRGCVEGESAPGILIPQLISLYNSGQFPFERMVTTFDFQAINQAILASATGAVLKAVVTC